MVFFSIFSGKTLASEAECKPEYVIIQYTTAVGVTPPSLGITSDVLGFAVKFAVDTAIRKALSSATSILDIGQMMQTSNIFRHVHVIYAYRTIHLGKPSKWTVGYRKNICNSEGIDYHMPSGVNAEGGRVIGQKIEEITEQFNKECEEHQQNNQ